MDVPVALLLLLTLTRTGVLLSMYPSAEGLTWVNLIWYGVGTEVSPRAKAYMYVS